MRGGKSPKAKPLRTQCYWWSCVVLFWFFLNEIKRIQKVNFAFATLALFWLLTSCLRLKFLEMRRQSSTDFCSTKFQCCRTNGSAHREGRGKRATYGLISWRGFVAAFSVDRTALYVQYVLWQKSTLAPKSVRCLLVKSMCGNTQFLMCEIRLGCRFSSWCWILLCSHQ